ncbi:MAG TPA: beta-ketoacyl-ACP synthase III [Jatrophihabitans sp.]|nr:beta-ketoacyl-ACP synthase III [Jatrophihabitans sp.]
MTAGAAMPADSPGHASVICGIGYWLPPLEVTNADLCARLDTSEEWIHSRSGISTRRVATDGMLTSHLAVEAGARALESAGGTDVQALVLATTTPDRRCPATAPDVAARLGLAGIAAFDVSAVCTGFLYGLATAAGYIAAGIADRILLIAAETFTSLLDPLDRTTVPIFGDGAGAVVLRRGTSDEPGAVGPIVLGSDGQLNELITVDPDGSVQPDGAQGGYFRMRGREVFRLAVKRMSESAEAAAAATGWRLDEVDWLVTHQANARIVSAVATELGVSPDRMAQNIQHVGNTAGASIPILLAQNTADGRLASNDKVLLTAFGGGLTWGATTVVWPDLKSS